MSKAFSKVAGFPMALLLGVFILFYSCGDTKQGERKIAIENTPLQEALGVKLIVLGIVQDAGSPQLGCTKACCRALYLNPDPNRRVVSLGLIDQASSKSYLVEATPDIANQLYALHREAGQEFDVYPAGIFLTHAHIGHYTGLMYLGKEAASTARIPVYSMPRMFDFLERNSPWDQLIANGNIVLNKMQDSTAIALGPTLRIVPFLVPHRDEYSETVGFTIEGPNKKVLFIPDIDKWHKWDTSIIQAIKGVDYAFLDAVFYDTEEITHRDISEIPHPFVVESMELFKDLPESEKSKIHFIHLNHTNPLLDSTSQANKRVIEAGYHIAAIHSVFNL